MSDYGPNAKRLRVMMHDRFGVSSEVEALRFIANQYGYEIASLDCVFSNENSCGDLLQSITWAGDAGLTDEEIKRGIVPPLTAQDLDSIHRMIERGNSGCSD